ncbi:chemotaxis protein CheD [Natrarchaeobius chitinivorans]|uniref:Probable chemoreceptor glutamine deamidase CheD n=1 Tax=Natrarchaeobius chitinivorans TaxID=1679083 RepID=A0A3N6MDF8_NATCH|nr:chemotaxis protein CheD [Natrarchaeobius chitinivorans]RQG93591.1 chemotaxis protein CheD [Natrarchaeobius chitinivorans]
MGRPDDERDPSDDDDGPVYASNADDSARPLSAVTDGTSSDVPYGAGRSREALLVGIADFEVTDDATLLKTSGLGSCIGVAVHDETAGVSGLLHFMLPAAADAHSRRHPDAKFADTGISAMLSAFREIGGDPARSWAKSAGAATMVDFPGTNRSIGERNIDAVTRELEAAGVRIAATDFGGQCGRSIEFDPVTGTLTVSRADGSERML